MRIRYISHQWLVSVIACLLCLAGVAPAVADAKSDISISPKGVCTGGGVTFVITNRNGNNSIHATVTQSTNSGTTTMDISLLPKEEKVLGCAPQGPAGNFLVTWQVQSAQYQ